MVTKSIDQPKKKCFNQIIIIHHCRRNTQMCAFYSKSIFVKESTKMMTHRTSIFVANTQK